MKNVDKNKKSTEEWENYRRRYYIATATLRLFASGAETSIINPSVWFYLKRFHATHAFLGIIMGSFQFSSILAAVAVGRIYDNTRRTKILALATNFGELIGNIIYSLGYSKYVLLIGRLICGLGEGFLPVVYAEVGSVVSAEERLRTIAFFEGGRALGAVIGPVLNFAFMKVNFSIGTWHITYGSAAGLVMAIFWTMVQILTAIFIYDMYREKKLKEDEKDKRWLLDLDEDADLREGISENSQQEDSKSLKEGLLEIFTREILTVMFADFLFWLSYGANSALTPLLLVEDLHWNPSTVVCVYLILGVMLTGSFIAVQRMPHFNDVTMLTICCFGSCLVEGSRMMYQFLRPNIQAMEGIFIATCFVYPIIAAGSSIIGRSLVTKLVGVQSQGLTQGVYTIVVALAMMIGPMIGSVVLYHLYIYGILAIVGYLTAAALLKYNKKRIDARVTAIQEQTES